MRKAAFLLCLCLPLVSACGDGEDDDDVIQSGLDAGGPGVCILSNCPAPDTGSACCLPAGRCGQDPLGIGSCQPNPGDPWTDNVCRVRECPLPTIGNPCCTSFGTCGNDPFGLGTICYANSPIDRTDAAVPEPNCPIDECPLPDIGFSCCTNDGECGTDPNGLGACYPNPVPVDAAVPDPTCPIADCPLPEVGFSCCTNAGECGVDPNGFGVCYPPIEDAGTMDIDVTPPDDPSVTGECPSYIAVGNIPVWGCCSDFGVCGTFMYDTCLLPVGTQIPVGPPPEDDAGVQEPFLRCEPPADD